MTTSFEDLEDDSFVNPSQIAKMFGVRPYTVRNWIKAGKFKAERMQNGRLKIRKSEVLKFVQQEFGDDSDSNA